MTAIKEIAQVFKKLTQVRRLDKTLQPKLINALPQKDVDIFGKEQGKILAGALEDAKAVSMKRAGKNRRFAAQALCHTLLQFVGGIVSKSNRQDFFRLGVALLNQPGNALHQNSRLTGACASQHQHGTVQVFNRALLCRIGREFGHAETCCCIMRKKGEVSNGDFVLCCLYSDRRRNPYSCENAFKVKILTSGA